MKSLKTITLLFILSMPFATSAQTEAAPKKNEVGTDITALINQVFNFNSSNNFDPYSSVYQLTYKRHFKKFSARVGVGGSTAFQEDYNSNYNEVYTRSFNNMSYRLGIEKPIELSTRWNFYYGVDFKHSISNSSSEFNYQNGGWIVGSNRENTILGISPLFGIEFRLNERISLQTEANFFAYYSLFNTTPIITQVAVTPTTDRPIIQAQESTGIETTFGVPSFLVLSIRL